jgi:SNF2 family DNA or RNA helicase
MFFHDQKRDLLVYSRENAPLHALPDAKIMNGYYFAVPRTLTNCQVLRFYNYPVPPIMDGYDYPIMPGRKPLLHQKAMANFLVLHPRCFNLSDPGAMKTMSALWAADWLMHRHPKGKFRALVIAPLSILERTWADAIHMNFLGKRTFEVLHGSAQQRLRKLEESRADFFIVNFDGVGIGARTRRKFELDGFSRVLAENSTIKLAIVDEASAYKDARTKRHRLARLIFGQKPYLWLMSGTPVSQAPTDAYGLGKLVNNAFGKSFKTFQNETMQKISQFKWIPRKDGYEQARKLLTPAIRFALEDIWDGPECTTEQRQVELTPEQKKLLKELKNRLQVKLDSGAVIDMANEAAARTKFLQIVQGEIYDHAHEAHAVAAAPRINELKHLVETAGGKAIVFSNLTSVLNMLHSTLKEGVSCGLVIGATSPKERTKLFQGFQEGADPVVLLADPRCMAHGLDLWQARRTIWFGPPDSTEYYLQANRRMHRPGQVHPSSVIQLVATPVEREIYRRREANENDQGVLLEAVKRGDF